MNCPYCGSGENKVTDKRESSEGAAIRRRRECLKCGKRWTTYERTESLPMMVIKKDERREPFDREKIRRGILKATEKRPVSMDVVEAMVNDVESQARKNYDKEVPSDIVGSLIISELKKVDHVAYIRFASVYKDFQDVKSFEEEIREIKSAESDDYK